MTDYRQILVAVDFSDATVQVCARAAEVARSFGAALTFIHVVEPIIVDPIYDVLPSIPVELEAQQLELARKRLSELGAGYGVEGRHCRIESGSTRAELLRVAAEIGADLVILGSHGRSGVGRLLGSTTSAVMHTAPCDVLAVRIGAGAK